MKLTLTCTALGLALLAACSTPGPAAQTPTTAQKAASQAAALAMLTQQVRDTETAFAKTMADRDHAAFSAYLADEAVFMGGKTALHGKAAVAAAWKKFYDGPQAPFSWRPEQVEVLDSASLAQTSGPVFDDHGERIGRFTSVWRHEAPGVWRIVFDSGCDLCRCAKP